MHNAGTTDCWADLDTREARADSLEAAVLRAFGYLSPAEIRALVERALADSEEEA